MVVVEHVVNVNAKFLKVVVQFSQLKKVILMQKKKMKVGDLSCQVAVKNDLKLTVPEDVFGVKEWECEGSFQ